MMSLLWIFLSIFYVVITIIIQNESGDGFVDSFQNYHHHHHHHYGRYHHNTASTTHLNALSTVNDEPMTTAIKSTESKRLQKAKFLLEVYQSNEMKDALMTDSPPPPIIKPKPKPPRTTSASRITLSSKNKINNDMINDLNDIDNNNNNIDNVVPDNYWRNGHLISSDDDDSDGYPDIGSSSSTDANGMFVTRWTRGANVAEPLIRYDPIKAEKILFRQPTKWVIRNFQIAIPLGWWAITVVSDYINETMNPLNNNQNNNDDNMILKQQSDRRRKRAKQLTKALSSLGPAIIKGGQALASRPDLLPTEYLEELQTLQDDVPRFSNDLAIATIEKELNIQNFNDLFIFIQNEPVAAASIGQVYKAKLIENGDIIALKIQRPNCEEIVALDLYILRWWSGIYNILIKNILKRNIDLQSIIDDFGILIYRELDYIAEASNAQRFNELYAGITPDVFVPKVYSDYTTSRVLTMEWVDGYRITTDSNILKEQFNINVNKLMKTLVSCSVRQILENGFFHADPHAGNLLACPDGRLCYLDFGMMSYANQKQRNGFLLAVIHIVNRDWNELAKLYITLGFIPVGTDLKPIVLALEKALPDVLNADISELNFKNVINSLGDVFYTFPFTLPPFYIAIIRCLGVLEGLAIQVDPSIKVISECYPYVASRVLTDKQVDLQEAFRRLVFTNDGKVRWERLEGLLDEASSVNDYDAAAALDLFTDYMLMPNNNKDGSSDDDSSSLILDDISIQLVDYIDTLSREGSQYVMEAIKAFTINDEVAAVRAFRSLSELIQTQRNIDDFREKVNDELRDGLPEPKPSMKRLSSIILLLFGNSNNNVNNNDIASSSTTSTLSIRSTTGRNRSNNNNNNNRQDFTKFVPIIRKLTSSPKVQKAANEVIARLGERILSRSLRAVFGLPPPPAFGKRTSYTTVTEDRE